MKTLIISYLPTGANSNTKKLLDHFISKIDGKTEIELVDLVIDQPDLYNYESLGAYYTRNYGGQPLSAEQEKAIAKFDKFSKQAEAADVIVVAHPMHNFSVPAAVKGWIDSIQQKGVAFDYGDKGPYGKYTNKKAVVLYSSGGAYADTPYAFMDTIPNLWKANFSFVGISEIEIIAFAGTNNVVKYEEILANAKSKIDEAVNKLYK